MALSARTSMPAPAVSPVPLGASPFHVKGVLFQGTLEWVDRHVPGGREALLPTLPTELEAYLRKPLLAGSWFDVFAIVQLSVGVAHHLRRSHLETLRSIAVEQCERDFHGIYKVLLKLASPDLVMERIPKTANTYFDFVTAEVEKLGPGHYRTTGSGVPVPAMHTYMAVTEAFLTRVLVLTGATDVTHRWLTPESEGYTGPYPRVRARREIRWTPR